MCSRDLTVPLSHAAPVPEHPHDPLVIGLKQEPLRLASIVYYLNNPCLMTNNSEANNPVVSAFSTRLYYSSHYVTIDEILSV